MIIDCIAIGILLICMMSGAGRGFIRSLVGLCSNIFSVVIGVLFYDAFLEMLYAWQPAAEKVVSFKESVEKAAVSYLHVNQKEVPTVYASFFDKKTINPAAEIADMAVNAAAGVLFIVLIMVVVKAIMFFATATMGMPVLRQFDRALGGITGLLSGIIICYILSIVIMFFMVDSGESWIATQMNQSFICKYFYKYNLILNVLVGF